MIEAACMGCGTCAGECGFEAITARHFTTKQLNAQIDGVLREDPASHVFAFACNWCSYAGGDGAGVARLNYPATSVLVKTMCSGRVSQEMILRAFARGGFKPNMA